MTPLILLGCLVIASVSGQRREPLSDSERFPLTGNLNRPIPVGSETDIRRGGSASATGDFGFDNNGRETSNSRRTSSGDSFGFEHDPVGLGSSSSSSGSRLTDSRRPSDETFVSGLGSSSSSSSGGRLTDSGRPSDEDFLSGGRGSSSRDRKPSRGGDDESSFVITGFGTTAPSSFSGRDRRPSPSGDRDDSSFQITGGSSSSGRGDSLSGRGNSFPQNYRIEYELVRLDNPDGKLANGKSCDTVSKCDPKVYALVDTESPNANWPGTLPVNRWPVIFTADNVDSTKLNKVASRDVCGGSIREVALRVYVVDADSVTSEDEINKFLCRTTLTPSLVASDFTTAQWGPEVECEGTSKTGKSRLFARQRAYEISSSNCNSQRLM